MRLVYLGTPEIAVPPLRALHAAGHRIELVVTRPDKRRGRGSALSPSPVKEAGIELSLPVSHDVDDVIGAAREGAELGVVVAYGRIISREVLDALPMVNLHFSLLPRWRGAAPVERAILAGDTATGVCVMEVVDELDAGGIYRSARLDIGPDETAAELRARLVEAGTELLVDALASGLGGLGDPEPQQGEPTYASKIEPAELELRWDRPAIELHRVVRVGGAWTTFRGQRLKVWRTRVVGGGHDGAGAGALAPGELSGVLVGTGDGAVELVEVQPAGRARVDAAAWSRGARPRPGERLGG